MPEESLPSLLSEFETAMIAEDLTTAEDTYEDILDIYQEERTDELSLATRGRVADIENEAEESAVNDFTDLYAESLTVRYRFKILGGLLVDKYEELSENEREDIQAELEEAIAELKTIETELSGSADDAANAVDDVDVPADIELLYIDAELEESLEPGETDTVEVALSNVGDNPAEEVAVSVTGSDPIAISDSDTTDTLGRVDAGAKQTRTYGFEILEAGDGRITVTVESANAGDDTLDRVIPTVEVIPTGFVTGQIVDPNDEAIPDAEVEAVGMETEVTEALTDVEDDGWYTLELPIDQEYELIATAPGFESGTAVEPVPVEEDLTSSGDIVLVPTDTDEPSVEDYTDEDGNTDTDELREAINDWREDQIDTDVLRDVIDAWRG